MATNITVWPSRRKILGARGERSRLDAERFQVPQVANGDRAPLDDAT